LNFAEPDAPLPPDWPAPGEQSTGPVRQNAELRPDLRVPWGWWDIFLFIGFAMVSSVVLLLLVAHAASAMFHVPLVAMQDGSTLKSGVLIVNQTLWSAVALAYLFAVVRLRTPEPFWRSIGWRSFPIGVSPLRFLSGGAALAIGISIAERFTNQNVDLPIEKLFDSRVSLFLLMSMGVLVAPLVEETIFRGFLFPVIARQFGVPAGILTTGILFGLLHAAQLWGGWGQIALLVCVGIVLTWVRAGTRTVAASYLVHLGYNSLLFFGSVLATGGFKHLPPHG
jgi:membrane protease YdiL (CAAX protease family)